MAAVSENDRATASATAAKQKYKEKNKNNQTSRFFGFCLMVWGGAFGEHRVSRNAEA